MPPPQPQRPLTDRGAVTANGDLSDKGTWASSGLLYQIKYSNFHKDPTPVCVFLYVDRSYAHGLNISYIGSSARTQFKKQIHLWFPLDPRARYFYLKHYNPSCLICYRTYITQFCRPITAWTIPELEGIVPQAYSLKLKGAVNGPRPTDFGKFAARAIKSAKIQSSVMGNRPTQRANQQRPDPRVQSGRIRPLIDRVRSAVQRINRSSIRPNSTRPS